MPHRPGCRAVCLLAVLLLLIGLSPPGSAQQITYQYDALGRLILVSTPEGIAEYEYDAVGNLLRIVTHKYAEASGPVAILGMSPSQGVPGTIVQLYGRGFGATPAENQVAFHGTSAPVTAATASTLTVAVPTGATTGPVSVPSRSGHGEPSKPPDRTAYPPPLSSLAPAPHDFRSPSDFAARQPRLHDYLLQILEIRWVFGWRLAVVPHLCYGLGRGRCNMSKTSSVRARIEPDLKEKAERVLQDLGLSPTQAIRLFYKQVELRNGLPFAVAIPTATTVRTFEETDAGRNLVICKDADDMFRRLGI